MGIEQILEKTLSGLGYECVDVELTTKKDLRVFIDKPEGVTIDDCVLVSNHLSRLLMVEDIDYENLEVSSPGLDRVLKKEKDFQRFTGSLARIQTRLAIDGQKKFTGRIVSCLSGSLILELKNLQQVSIELKNIEKARLKPEI